MADFKLNPKKRQELVTKFETLLKSSIDEQVEFFLKSFIFALGNEWKKIYEIADDFKAACRLANEGRDDLNPVQASNFLQKHGVTRTASERTAEIKDIDFNSDNRISFLEYVILQYKAMILKQFYERNEDDPVEDLSNGAVGVVGVGDKLLDELFTLVGKALDPEIEAALEEMTRKKKAQAAKLKELEERAAAGGVKGKAAANEIVQLKQQDPTEFNRLEITLNAAKRKALKSSGDVALSKKKKMEADSEKKKLQASRERLAAKAALFNSQEKVNSASPTQPRKSPNNNLSSGHSGSVSAIANKFGNVGGRIATTESNEDLAA